MTDFKVIVDDKAAHLRIENLKENLQELQPVFVNFQAYMKRRQALMFRRLRKGGSFRGVTWRPFANLYTRKSTGETIPAWGGVERLDGQGLVLGRKRTSGKRITKNSSIMRDRGRLAIASLSDHTITSNTLTMDTPEEYAKYQNAARPFQFFEVPKDTRTLQRLIKKQIEADE